jgi:very-short-patch-repair endonuclease
MYRDPDQRAFARSLRNELTNGEKHLWRFLRAQQLAGHKFRRQAAIGQYVVDFVCFSHKLIVELDGPQHAEQPSIDHDARRTAWLSSRGFQVLRFRNQELDDNIHAVVDSITQALSELSMKPPSPTLPAEGREPNQNV